MKTYVIGMSVVIIIPMVFLKLLNHWCPSINAQNNMIGLRSEVKPLYVTMIY